MVIPLNGTTLGEKLRPRSIPVPVSLVATSHRYDRFSNLNTRQSFDFLFRFSFEMDVLEFPTQVQRLLLKKEQEYGQLKFISSRATEETSCFIDELLEEIRNIVKKLNLYDVKLFYEYDAFKPSTISPHVISNYNHFLLNTNFSSQPLLVEDVLLGHIVNFWPTLSPYLFIQIIWHMKYEDLLIESLAHLPLDLCVDILDITIRCINELEIPRARRLIFLLISKLYLKCQWLHWGTLAERDLTELVQELVAHFQTLLDLVSSKLVILKSSVQERYVQHGILLKNILCCIKTCMSYKTKNFPDIIEMVQPFEITYGTSNSCKNHSCKLPIDEVKSVVATLDQELITLFLNQIKQVDCFEFMEWAEVDNDDDDDGTISISLQRALIIKCHNFMEFMKQNEILSTNDHLLHCLEQLVGPKKPEESILTLDELCHTIENGNLDNMKELIKHYKKWNLSVLQFVSTKTELLSTKDVGILLEYLHYMFTNAHIYEEEQQAYMLISKVLMQQELLNMYYVVLQYTLQHFHDTRLESLFNNVHFKNLIESNINMRDHQKFRVILIFIMLNPKKVLTTLVRVAIGSTKMEYRNVMFKRPQMYFLYAFLVSKLNDESNLLTYLLNDAWLHDHSTWHYKEFEAFMNDTLEKEILTPDDLINNVYIPYLTYDVFNCSNLLSVLIHMYYILKKRIYTHKMNYVLLIIELTRKISLLRKCNSMYLRSIVNNLLDRATMILNFLFASLNLLTSTKQTSSEIMNKVNNFVEPIDQILLAPLSQTILRGTVQDVIQNYERRVATYQLSVNSQREPNTSHDCMYSSKLDRKVLLRHMMLHATEEEYKNFAVEMTVVSWSYFGWTNELVAYENILHITAEAVQLALMFTDTFSKDTAVSLLRALMHYCNTLLSLKHQMCKNQETMFNILSRTLFSLQSTMRETQYNKRYDNLLEQINDMRVDSNTEITNYFCKISELIEEYFVRAEEIDNGSSDQLKDGSLSNSASTTSKTADMFKEYQFVRKCIEDTAYRKKNISQVIIE